MHDEARSSCAAVAAALSLAWAALSSSFASPAYSAASFDQDSFEPFGRVVLGQVTGQLGVFLGLRLDRLPRGLLGFELGADERLERVGPLHST